ncbi:hypothetical protein MES5069_760003 [Mesorhizobium escarrei]|uniref:Uncharacterized protein n=1 Tax=Mesorhizobium escarrei TaxID=666018 RepID=A0ABN8KIQ6_9HYPH|nr:hypothetical protein MES5069_760003 [Mesorhizobium escarrei]
MASKESSHRPSGPSSRSARQIRRCATSKIWSSAGCWSRTRGEAAAPAIRWLLQSDGSQWIKSSSLHKYTTVPASLQNPSSKNSIDEIPVDMAGLFHHYYLDTDTLSRTFARWFAAAGGTSNRQCSAFWN